MQRFVKIADIVLNLDEHSMVWSGQPKLVPPRVQRLLFYLLNNPDRLITKEELNKYVWDSRPIEDSVISHTVWQVRKCLEDERRDIIRTASRRGYICVIPKECWIQAPSAGEALTEWHEDLSQQCDSRQGVHLLKDADAPAEESRATQSKGDEFVNRKPSARSAAFWFVLTTCLLMAIISFRANHGPNAVVINRFTESQEVQDLLVGMTAKAARSAGWDLLNKATSNSGVLIIDGQWRDFSPMALSVSFASNGRTDTLPNLSESFFEILEARMPPLDQTQHQEATINLSASYNYSGIWEAQQPRLRAGLLSASDIARLSFVLNEIGRTRAASFYAAQALRQKLDNDSRCLASFVVADGGYQIASQAHLPPVFTCSLAKARRLELEGKVREARIESMQSTSGEMAVLFGMKLAEISLRLDAGGAPSDEMRARCDELIELAKRTGWREYTPRLLELKSSVLGVSLQPSQRDQALLEAESAYLAVGDQSSADRVWLRRIVLQSELTEAERNRLAVLLDVKGDIRLSVVARLAAAKWLWNEELLGASIDQLMRDVSSLPSIVEKQDALVVLAGIASVTGHKSMREILRKTTQIYSAYPLLRLRAQFAEATSGSNAASGMALARAAHGEAERLGIEAELVTSFCGAAKYALVSGDMAAADVWGSMCISLPMVDSYYNCLKLWGIAARIGAARNIGLAFPLPTIQPIIDADTKRGHNCAYGVFYVARELIRSGKSKEARKVWADSFKELRHTRALEENNDWLDLELCFLSENECSSRRIANKVDQEFREPSSRASFLMMQIAADNGSCNELQQRRLEAWRTDVEGRGEHAQRALECAERSCRNQRLECPRLQLAWQP